MTKEYRGFAALTFVLIVATISLIIGLTISQLNVGEMNMELGKVFSEKSYYLANLCAEEALMKLKNDTNYQGNESMDVEGGNCNILPIEGTWIIQTRGNYQNYFTKIKVVVNNIHPKIVVQSWEEVADF